jgi:hypothetical protein
MTVITLLLGLGLTAEEAAHFLAWGSQRRRRRRGRGISGRDLRTTTRTMRKVIRISAAMRELCGGGGGFGRRSFRPRHRYAAAR